MSFVIRLCLALWLFAFLAGASYAMGKEHDDAPLVAHSDGLLGAKAAHAADQR